MRRLLALFALLLSTACASEDPPPARPTSLGCVQDTDCDDDQPETTDRCGLSRHACHHTVKTASGCRMDQDCDDRLDSTADHCVDRTCHHTLTTPVPDPASPERQNARLLCETDQSCVRPASGPFAELYWIAQCDWFGFNNLSWDEQGYPFFVAIHRVGTVRRVHVRPQLRVGDRMSRYRVTLQRNDTFASTPFLIDRELSVAEIEAGFEIELGSARLVGWEDVINLSFLLRPIGEPSARTLQWALPPDGVVDLDRRVPLNRCLAVGRFQRLPENGLLRIGTSTDGRPACQGTPRRIELGDFSRENPYGGLVREAGSPELSYVDVAGRRILRFRGLLEFADWYRPSQACAQVHTIPDGSLALLSDWERREVGIRPGIMVTWLAADGTRRRGMADRGFVIYDLTDRIDAQGRADTSLMLGAACTAYNTFRRNTPEAVDDCLLDIQSVLDRYEVRSAPPSFRIEPFSAHDIIRYFLPRP